MRYLIAKSSSSYEVVTSTTTGAAPGRFTVSSLDELRRRVARLKELGFSGAKIKDGLDRVCRIIAG